MKIRGTGSYTDTSDRNHTILGVGELPDDMNLKNLEVSGNLSFEKISCDKISISGKCTGGSVCAQSLKISGTCEGDSITVKNFSASGKVEVDSLTAKKNLEIAGKPKIDFMTADEIFIETSNGFLGEVKCRKIKIFENSARLREVMFGKNFVEHLSFNNSRVQINSIEAEIVDLENCAVEVVRCKDAFIGINCTIEKLFVAGECKVSTDSTVGEMIRT